MKAAVDARYPVLNVNVERVLPGLAAGGSGTGQDHRRQGGSRPILLKDSLRAFPAAILGVSDHHPTNLRGTERDLEGRFFRRRTTPPGQLSLQQKWPRAALQ
jgi:hypothetical protein